MKPWVAFALLGAGCGREKGREVATAFVEPTSIATRTATPPLDPSKLTDTMIGKQVSVRANVLTVTPSADGIQILSMMTADEDYFHAGLLPNQSSPTSGPITVRCKFIGWRTEPPFQGDPFGDDCAILP